MMVGSFGRILFLIREYLILKISASTAGPGYGKALGKIGIVLFVKPKLGKAERNELLQSLPASDHCAWLSHLFTPNVPGGDRVEANLKRVFRVNAN
jgi:hypothetical protein